MHVEVEGSVFGNKIIDLHLSVLIVPIKTKRVLKVAKVYHIIFDDLCIQSLIKAMVE